MKIFFTVLLSVFFLIHTACAIEHMQYNPILVVVLMVKNEETVMRATLQPFVDAGIHSYLIFDTGSTDNTVAVTQEMFDEHRVTARLIWRKSNFQMQHLWSCLMQSGISMMRKRWWSFVKIVCEAMFRTL